jgi:hypothetical protein
MNFQKIHNLKKIFSYFAFIMKIRSFSLFERKRTQKKQTNLQFDRLCGVLWDSPRFISSFFSLDRRVAVCFDPSLDHAQLIAICFFIPHSRAHNKECRTKI